MKKNLFLFSLIISSLFLSTSVNAQEKGDIFVGASTSLSNGRLVDLQPSPEIGYQFADKFALGVNISYYKTNQSSFDSYTFNVKYYPGQNLKPTLKTFVKGSFGTSFADDGSWLAGLQIGGTSFLSKWFYIEPTIGLVYSEYPDSYSTRFTTGFTCGIRL